MNKNVLLFPLALRRRMRWCGSFLFSIRRPDARGNAGPSDGHRLARRGSAHVGAAADGSGDHGERPSNAALPVRRRLDAGRRIGERGQLQRHRVHRAEFRRLGLKPAGDNGTYFQDCHTARSGSTSRRSRFSPVAAPLAAKNGLDADRTGATKGHGQQADLNERADGVRRDVGRHDHRARSSRVPRQGRGVRRRAADGWIGGGGGGRGGSGASTAVRFGSGQVRRGAAAHQGRGRAAAAGGAARRRWPRRTRWRRSRWRGWRRARSAGAAAGAVGHSPRPARRVCRRTR